MRYTILRVTLTEDYLVPLFDDTDVIEEGTITEINGWPLGEVIRSWFTVHSINSHHATRDAYRLGGGRQFVAVEILPVLKTEDR